MTEPTLPSDLWKLREMATTYERARDAYLGCPCRVLGGPSGHKAADCPLWPPPSVALGRLTGAVDVAPSRDVADVVCATVRVLRPYTVTSDVDLLDVGSVVRGLAERDDLTAALQAKLDAAVAEGETLRERVEQLEAALGQTVHYLVLGENGWSVGHLVACRALGMDRCPVHIAATAEADDWHRTLGDGRYAVEVDEHGFLQPATVAALAASTEDKP